MRPTQQNSDTRLEAATARHGMLKYLSPVEAGQHGMIVAAVGALVMDTRTRTTQTPRGIA